MIDTIVLNFTGLHDLDSDLRSQEWEKAKTTEPIISQSFESIALEFRMLLRLVSVILSQSFSIQGGESYLHDFLKKKANP